MYVYANNKAMKYIKKKLQEMQEVGDLNKPLSVKDRSHEQKLNKRIQQKCLI